MLLQIHLNAIIKAFRILFLYLTIITMLLTNYRDAVCLGRAGDYCMSVCIYGFPLAGSWDVSDLFVDIL